MTLRQAIEKKRDELADEVGKELHIDGTWGSKVDFKAGADAMLELLWPCVERLEQLVKDGYANKVDKEALTQLRRRVE